jgi:hypothetical protein
MPSNDQIQLVNSVAVLASVWCISRVVGSEAGGLVLGALICGCAALRPHGFAAYALSFWVSIFHRIAGTIP